MSDHPEQADALRTLQDWQRESEHELREAFKRTALAAVLYGTASIDASGLSAVQAFVVRDIYNQYQTRQFQARALRWFRR